MSKGRLRLFFREKGFRYFEVELFSIVSGWLFLRFRLHPFVHFVFGTRGCLRLFLLVLGCPVCFSLCQFDAIDVGGCRLHKSCFVFGLFLLLEVVARCFGCFGRFEIVLGFYRFFMLI